MFNILIVEDDSELRKLYSTVLKKNGYHTLEAENGEDALNKMDHEYIDLIISDVMMPAMDGLTMTKLLREAGFDLPVLLITAKGSFDDKAAGFRAGTDDYMVKPIDVKEMVLRVGALLRRAQIVSERQLKAGSTLLEYDALTVTVEDESIILPQKEFYLLYKLLSYPNHIFTRQQLMDEIWGMETETEARTVDVHIGRLRDRFKENKDFEIVTIRGLGYKSVRKS